MIVWAIATSKETNTWLSSPDFQSIECHRTKSVSVSLFKSPILLLRARMPINTSSSDEGATGAAKFVTSAVGVCPLHFPLLPIMSTPPFCHPITLSSSPPSSILPTSSLYTTNPFLSTEHSRRPRPHARRRSRRRGPGDWRDHYWRNGQPRKAGRRRARECDDGA